MNTIEAHNAAMEKLRLAFEVAKYFGDKTTENEEWETTLWKAASGAIEAAFSISMVIVPHEERKA